jgi:serine/threonine-protein kinase
MKYCPQCNLEYEDETVFCATDGSRLQPRLQKSSTKPMGGLGGMSLGSDGVVLSSQPISALGATALQAPTPARGTDTHRAPRAGRAPAARAAPASNGAQAMMNLADPEPLDPSELTTRQPAVSTEMPAVGANKVEDDIPDQPTVAMRTPVGQANESDEPSLVGAVVAERYKVLRRLGEGGMGVVYEAVDDRLEKHVAVKVLREDFARRQDVVARFTQEAKSAARIKHENVLDVTDYGQTKDGSFYIAMELLVGTDLADVLQAEGTLGQERGVEVAVQVCRALQAAHQKGIVHRDMKPENVFLVRADDGREVVKIVDFGIAQMKDISGSAEGSRKLTRTGMIFGTPEYMSPEQAAGKPVDHRVDVYAAGVILYEMFAGRVPFVGDSFMGILTQHMFEQPPKIGAVNPNTVVSPELEAVIFKALAKDPGQRYQSMQEFADDLQRFRSGARTNAALAPPSAPVIPPGAAQVLGIGSTPGAALPPLGQVPVTAGVSRTVEGDLSPAPTKKRTIALVAAILLLVFIAGGAVVAYALSGSDAPPTRPTVTPTPTPTPPALPAARVPTPTPPTPTPPTPTVAADAAVAPVAAPARVTIRVVPHGFTARTITFRYATPQAGAAAIEPCEGSGDCRRLVLSGVPLQVTMQNGRRQGTMTVTPSRDGEEFEIQAAPRPSGRPASGQGGRTQPAQGNGRRPCGGLNPTTGLMDVCFD